jgi:hypothetical protein
MARLPAVIPFIIGEPEPEEPKEEIPPGPPATPAIKPAVVAPFSYYSFDFLTGAFQGQVPLRTVTFSKQLNTAGTLAGTLDLSDLRVQETYPLQSTIPNRSFIVVDYGGAALWGGVVMTRKPKTESSSSSTTGTLEVSCSETWAWFQHRVQATDYSSPPYSGISGEASMSLWTGTPWDASLIGCQILEDVLGYADGATVPHGNPLGGLAVLLNGETPSASKPAAPATDYVAVNYPYPSMQLVDTIISQLAQLGLGVGFDYAVDIAYGSGDPLRPVGVVNLSYPRRGRTVAQGNLMVDITTARGYEFPEDGSEIANRVYELGGSGAISVSENEFTQEQGYALWERVVSRANIQSQNITEILTQTGFSDLAIYSYPPVTPSITIAVNDPNLPLGSYIEGDDVLVVVPTTIERGGKVVTFDSRFPAGLKQEYRITGYSVEPKDEGDATVKLSLAPPPYTQAIAPTI